MNQKKFYRDLKFGVLKPKIFIILFCLFFSSLAFAAALSVTWLERHMGPNPGGACSTHDGLAINKDGAEDPQDIAFSNDGLQYFTGNELMQSPNGYDITMYRLETPYDLNTMRNDCSQDRFDLLSIAGDGGAPGVVGGGNNSVWTKIYDMEFSTSGDKIFLVNGPSYLMQFSLTTPFDLKTATFDLYQDLDPNYGSVAFNRDGTKMFWLEQAADATKVRTYDLGSPFDITSYTLVHTLDLSSTELNSASGSQMAEDINFNDTGSAAYILINDGGDATRTAIYQFSLEKNYDMSTASLIGSAIILFGGDSGIAKGFAFGLGGMKLFVTDLKTGNLATVDRTNVYQLECPYGIAQCTSDPTSSVGSQVELSKQNISLNVSTIFKRFEWIKRNRNSNNLNNLNVSIKFDNPMLNYWVKKLPTKIVSINGPAENGQSITIGSENKNSNNLNNFTTTIKSDNPLLSSWMNKLPENITALKVSLKEKLGKYKKSNWSYWSLGDLSINNYDKHGFEKAKDIKSEGLTFGADRKFGDNKFLGLALRYGGNKSNISDSQQKTDMESLTLNIYGIIPVNEDKYINAVVGLSALRFDNKYLDKLSGERNGKQAFTSINYRTKNTYGKFNITPTGKLTYGVTRLSKFTDFISNTIDSPATNIIYAEDTFESGEFSAGFLFEMDKMEDEDGGTFQPMGGIEILYDLTPNINYKYTYEGSTAVNKDTILGKYSRRSLKTEIGFEKVYLNGFTVSPIYERIISLNNDKGKNLYSERFIVKLSRSNEENNSEFAFNFNPMQNNQTNLNYKKTINGYDVVVSSNYSSNNQIPEYGANIEVSSVF